MAAASDRRPVLPPLTLPKQQSRPTLITTRSSRDERETHTDVALLKRNRTAGNLLEILHASAKDGPPPPLRRGDSFGSSTGSLPGVRRRDRFSSGIREAPAGGWSAFSPRGDGERPYQMSPTPVDRPPSWNEKHPHHEVGAHIERHLSKPRLYRSKSSTLLEPELGGRRQDYVIAPLPLKSRSSANIRRQVSGHMARGRVRSSESDSSLGDDDTPRQHAYGVKPERQISAAELLMRNAGSVEDLLSMSSQNSGAFTSGASTSMTSLVTDPNLMVWYKRIDSTTATDVEVRLSKGETMAIETALVEEWAKEARLLVSLNEKISRVNDLEELQSLVALTQAQDEALARRELVVDATAAVISRRQRVSLKRMHKHDLLRAERSLFDSATSHRMALQKSLFHRMERRHEEFAEMFDAGPELVMRFGDLLAHAAQTLAKEQKAVLSSRLHEEGLTMGRVSEVEAINELHRKVTLNGVDCSHKIELSNGQYTATLLTGPSPTPEWATVRATDCPWPVRKKMKDSDPADVTEVVKLSSLGALRFLAKAIDEVHTTQQIFPIVAEKHAFARKTLQDRLDSLGYETPFGGNLDMVVREIDTKNAVIQLLSQVRARAQWITKFYYEVYIPEPCSWAIGWTLDVMTESDRPGYDADSFALYSTGSVAAGGEVRAFCSPFREGDLIIGVLADLCSGYVAYYANGEELGVAFGVDSTCWGEEDRAALAKRLRDPSSEIIATFGLRNHKRDLSRFEMFSEDTSLMEHSGPLALLRNQAKSNSTAAAAAAALSAAKALNTSSESEDGMRSHGSSGGGGGGGGLTSRNPSRVPSRAPSRATAPNSRRSSVSSTGSGSDQTDFSHQPSFSVNFGGFPFVHMPEGAKGCDAVLQFEREYDSAMSFRTERDRTVHDHRKKEIDWIYGANREGHLFHLPDSWSSFPPTTHRRVAAARVIQRSYRMWIARRKRRHTVLQRVAAATTLAMWYGGLFKRRRAVKSAAAVKIQSVWRMYQVKVALELAASYGKGYHEVNSAAAKLQRWWRNRWLHGRKHALAKVIETEILMVIRAATSIQRLWRGFRFYRTAVRYMQEMRQSATLIQAWWRGVLVRKNMDPERRAACRRAERALLTRKDVIASFEQLLMLQRMWRRAIKRKIDKRHLELRTKAAIKIQAAWKGRLQRVKLYDTLGNAGYVRYVEAVAAHLRDCHYFLPHYQLTYMNP